MSPQPATGSQHLLLPLLRTLLGSNYHFITPTPLTHQRVLTRRATSGRGESISLQDIFGWNLPFRASAITPGMMAQMVQAGVVTTLPPVTSGLNIALFQSTVRVSSLGDDLFVHSAYPTVQSDAVFFGPDTYRFARFIAHTLTQQDDQYQPRNAPAVTRILDIGCGTGAGGIAAVRITRSASELTLNDINPQALVLAGVNAALAQVPVRWVPGDAMTQITGAFDVIVANPPYLIDADQRAYRHGGGVLGLALSLRMTATALEHLAEEGQFLLYTGVAMIDGDDPLRAALTSMFDGFDGDWHYSEIDPDVFGEELERPVYADIDRIAAVGLRVRRRAAR